MESQANNRLMPAEEDTIIVATARPDVVKDELVADTQNTNDAFSAENEDKKMENDSQSAHPYEAGQGIRSTHQKNIYENRNRTTMGAVQHEAAQAGNDETIVQYGDHDTEHVEAGSNSTATSFDKFFLALPAELQIAVCKAASKHPDNGRCILLASIHQTRSINELDFLNWRPPLPCLLATSYVFRYEGIKPYRYMFARNMKRYVQLDHFRMFAGFLEDVKRLMRCSQMSLNRLRQTVYNEKNQDGGYIYSDETDNNETDNNETDNNETDNNETDNNETDNNETDNNETDNNETDNNETDSNETDSNEIDSDKTDSNETNSDETDSDKTDSINNDSDSSGSKDGDGPTDASGRGNNSGSSDDIANKLDTHLFPPLPRHTKQLGAEDVDPMFGTIIQRVNPLDRAPEYSSYQLVNPNVDIILPQPCSIVCSLNHCIRSQFSPRDRAAVRFLGIQLRMNGNILVPQWQSLVNVWPCMETLFIVDTEPADDVFRRIPETGEMKPMPRGGWALLRTGYLERPALRDVRRSYLIWRLTVGRYTSLARIETAVLVARRPPANGRRREEVYHDVMLKHDGIDVVVG